jgi:hypothetical protein
MNALPRDVSQQLFLLSIHVLMKASGTESNEFDGLFPEFNYWKVRRELYDDTDGPEYEAARQLNPADLIRTLWRLGYPDLASRAQRFCHDHHLLP